MALLVPAGATPAWAHAGGLSSTASEARVLAVEPAVPGLTVEAVEFGARLRLLNGTAAPVAVDQRVVPPGAQLIWSEPRVAAAAADRPPAGRAEWTVPLDVDGRQVLVRGEQFWPPAPPAWLWIGIAIVLVIGIGAAGAAGGSRPWGRALLAAATLVVVLAHLLHVLGSAGVPADQPYLVMVLSAAGFALLGWPLGITGAVLTLRRNPAGPLLCVAAGALFAIVIAPVDAFTLVDAVVPFSWGADLDRALVVLTLGAGLGSVVAGMAALRQAGRR
ncbi:hypothetical protein [Pseudonocardia sp. TRM90224]|uniref:hypothetical protein n=1 Tax=Pseudonocardia sp. TRM90224 TaxID=2812678 RepID=UPI001E59A96B|nr:hypothetical protein [Pseudonocardia sp. TRM90224]